MVTKTIVKILFLVRSKLTDMTNFAASFKAARPTDSPFS